MPLIPFSPLDYTSSEDLKTSLEPTLCTQAEDRGSEFSNTYGPTAYGQYPARSRVAVPPVNYSEACDRCGIASRVRPISLLCWVGDIDCESVMYGS